MKLKIQIYNILIVPCIQPFDRRDEDGDGDRKWQWNLNDADGTMVGFMLNTDMELAYDIPVDSDLGTTSCAITATGSLDACPDATTKSLTETYATVRL